MKNQPTPPKRGQPLKSEGGRREQLRICFSQSNLAFMKSLGRGKHDYLNYLLDKVREKILNNGTDK